MGKPALFRAGLPLSFLETAGDTVKVETIALRRNNNYRRPAGSIQAALKLTDDEGRTGLAFYCYEWDKRETVGESLETEPQIADSVLAWLGNDSPQCIGEFSNLATAEECGSEDAMNDTALAGLQHVWGDQL